jgi:hypothetical protein
MISVFAMTDPPESIRPRAATGRDRQAKLTAVTSSRDPQSRSLYHAMPALSCRPLIMSNPLRIFINGGPMRKTEKIFRYHGHIFEGGAGNLVSHWHKRLAVRPRVHFASFGDTCEPHSRDLATLARTIY